MIIFDLQHAMGPAHYSLENRENWANQQFEKGFIKAKFEVDIEFYGDDELRAEGDAENLKKFLIWHYDDESEAKHLHPQLFA